MLKALALAATLAGQAAAPAPPGLPAGFCLTRQQLGDMGVVGTAIIVGVARNVCRGQLRPGAFLASEAGAAYVAGLQTEGRRRLPAIIASFERAMGPNANMGGPAVRTTLEGFLREEAGAEWSRLAEAGLCRDVDDLIEAMSPASPDQVARFLVAAVSLGERLSSRFPTTFHAPPPPASPQGKAPRRLALDVQDRPAQARPDRQGPVMVAPPAPRLAPQRPPMPRILCSEAG